MHVACAAEGEAYAAHSAAMLHSVLDHGTDVSVEYLHGPSFAPAWRDGIRGMVEAGGGRIRFWEIGDDEVEDLPVVWPFTVAMWYRIFLPRLVPDADRVLYLDVDTIALDALAPLWDLDLTGHWLGAVTNVLEPHFAHRPADLGLEASAYFNSGVLLLNLAEMRRDDRTAALRDYAVTHPDNDWPDQDALNVVLGERRLALPPRFNAMNSLRFAQARDVFTPGELREARERPAIRHFEGPKENKPWHYLCRRDLRDAYLAHRAAGPWPEVDLIGFTRVNRVRRIWRQCLTALRPG
jgi:lipopolysaccharide biosynthesis glycosyltransferase